MKDWSTVNWTETKAEAEAKLAAEKSKRIEADARAAKEKKRVKFWLYAAGIALAVIYIPVAIKDWDRSIFASHPTQTAVAATPAATPTDAELDAMAASQCKILTTKRACTDKPDGFELVSTFGCRSEAILVGVMEYARNQKAPPGAAPLSPAALAAVARKFDALDNMINRGLCWWLPKGELYNVKQEDKAHYAACVTPTGRSNETCVWVVTGGPNREDD